MDTWLNLLAATLVLLGAIIGLGQYLNFKSKQQRAAEVGHAFASVVAGLGSQNETERLANVALLRRFWDSPAEHGRGLVYGEDAIKVAVAVLHREPTGPVQKLLADSLRSAPRRSGRSFARTNLRDAYWGARVDGDEPPVDLTGADFFRADLSCASLRRAGLKGAQFREATLADAILIDADCTGANFQYANLRGTRFDGALLDGAKFTDANHIPPCIQKRLDDAGVFRGPPTCADAPGDVAASRYDVFISAPSTMRPSDRVLLDHVTRTIDGTGAKPRRFQREDYGPTPPLEEIARRVRTSRGLLVFGAPQFKVTSGVLREGTPEETPVDAADLPTPWNHIEAGIAVGLGKPILLVSQGSQGGVFDLPEDPGALDIINVATAANIDEDLARWLKRLDTQAGPHQE